MVSGADDLKAAVTELATEGRRLRARVAKQEAAIEALSARVGASTPAAGGSAQRGAGGRDEANLKDLRAQRDDAQFRMERATGLLKEILQWHEANPVKRGCHEPIPYPVIKRLIAHINEVTGAR